MKRITLVLAAALAVAGCASDPAADAPAVKTSIATATAGTGASALTVELLSDRGLETGMTPIYVKVTAGGQAVTDADVSFEPMMAMSGGMNHNCPVGTPVIGSDGLYHGWANFGMASSMMGSWSAKVGVTRPGQARVEASFPTIAVADSGRAKSFLDFDPDTLVTTKYLASIRFLSGPAVGLNPVAITLHRMAGMMSFPSVDDATIHMVPEMPSMGHGSTGNVDPVLVTSGVYQGTLGFSMTGAWETKVTFSRPAAGGGTRRIGSDQVFKTTF
jgi:hypothetical protein